MTPRPYLSWSQYNLYGRSAEQYRKSYILGVKGYSSPEMFFGSQMALIRESGDDEGLEHITMFLPKYPHREYEMTCKVKVDRKNVVLLGKFDGVDLKKNIIGDDKTGKKWTQAIADKCEQLTWYSFIYWKNTGIIPKLQLNWIETTKKRGKVVATGKTEVFETKRTLKDFIILNEKINKRWRGILELCKKEWEKVI